MTKLSIVDAHHHFWDATKNDHPWLRADPPIAFRYGDYSMLQRVYQPADLLRDAGRYHLAGSVYVETEWNPNDSIGEMRYVDTLRQASGLPSVAVAQAWLDRDDVESVLDQLCDFDFIRGIRHKPRANRAPGESRPGGMTDPKWRAGFAALHRRGMRFDLQTPWWHLHEAVGLARDFPAMPIIVNHTGVPSGRDPEAIAGWRAAMAAVAACPNVACKISGIGVRGQPWTADFNREIVLTAIELFGVARCMFASNYPVDGLCATYDEIYGSFDAITSGFSADERARLFRDNAIRIYAIAPNALRPPP